MLLPQTTFVKGYEVAERLLRVIAGLNFVSKRGPLLVTICLGVAGYPPDLPSLAALVDWADQAMYAAKQAGRNRVELYKQL